MNSDSINATESDLVIPSGGWNDRFDVFLPVNDRVDGDGATHVAHMRGNEHAYVDVLAEFVRTGAEISAPLRSPVDESSAEQLTHVLESIGQAKVESISPVGA